MAVQPTTSNIVAGTTSFPLAASSRFVNTLTAEHIYEVMSAWYSYIASNKTEGVREQYGRCCCGILCRESMPQRQGVFVDAVTGRHASTSAQQLLDKRVLTWSKDYGWTYDVWVDDPAKFALSGANGRFSLPALARHAISGVRDVANEAKQQVQQVHTRLFGATKDQQRSFAGIAVGAQRSMDKLFDTASRLRTASGS